MYTAYSRRIRQVRKATQTPRDLMMFLVSGFIDHLVFPWSISFSYTSECMFQTSTESHSTARGSPDEGLH